MRAPLLVASTLGCCLLGAASGCEKLLSIQDPVASDGPILDASDGPGPDAMSCVPSGLPQSSPLLLSEVALAPDAAEMIEIVNTSADDVPLSTYYLSDSGNYYRLPVSATVDNTDFIVKFPDNAVIHGHQAITVAIATPTDFASTYSVAPSYSLRDGSLLTIAMIGAPNLTNEGEPIILFQWDGCSDLVRDVDILIAGTPSSTNALTSKSNVSQDGRDLGTVTSKYAIDVGTIHAQAGKPGSGQSTKRILLEDNHETHGGTGNGQSGDDETSEDTSLTWDGPPFTAPTPGQVPAALLR